MFINTQMPAQHFAFPDVCQTPSPVGPIPVPYPNVAMTSTAIPTITNIFIAAMPVHNLLTNMPISVGDNAGVALNPMSGMVMGPTRHTMGSAKTLMGGMPVTKMLSPTGQNGMSPGAIGLTLTPSQVKVMALS